MTQNPNSTKRVRRHRQNQSAQKKIEIRKKNVERQRKRRKNMNLQQRTSYKVRDAQLKKAARASRSSEKIEADKKKDALRKRNKRNFKKIKNSFSEEDWMKFCEIAKLFPKEDLLNLSISDLMVKKQLNSFKEAKEFKERMISRLIQNHYGDSLWLDFSLI